MLWACTESLKKIEALFADKLMNDVYYQVYMKKSNKI